MAGSETIQYKVREHRLPVSDFWRLLLSAFVFGLLVACTSTVTCPANLDDPRPVFLLDHGRHASLVITSAEGELFRYGYGDWRYYAETDLRLRTGVRALLWPTPAGLARQSYGDIEPETEVLVNAVGVPIDEPHKLMVSGAAVDALRRDLDRTFERGAEQEYLVNRSFDFNFVPHPRDYWFWYSSNHMVVDWLDALDCESRGFTALTMHYRVETD
ncbi:hypothetical protein [Marinimicrobium sp. ABcell2]|uniref:hypothetical protein n=1 Tax=Marinimicrobium sp. ABcell2 TaxID=3069751 RepID=UPI0027AEBFDD|nr:hypothetical protein [Marinimicrobium sp. ABcell2]MDQ2076019.1 DUF2459 domain-containing protein [Marinimicrobium sp. ABcell2]